MTDSTLDAQKRKEAQARYDNINRRIEGVDRDISTETDGERLATLREKRIDLAAQRDAANSELMALDKRGNGDLHLLQQKVNELGRVLVSDRPEDAHAIINECAAALARMDARVMGLEGRVAAIEHRIDPPLVVTMWRAFAVLVLFFGGTLFWVKESREVLFGLYPWAGATLEMVLVLLVIVCLLMANAKLQERAR